MLGCRVADKPRPPHPVLGAGGRGFVHYLPCNVSTLRMFAEKLKILIFRFVNLLPHRIRPVQDVNDGAYPICSLLRSTIQNPRLLSQ